MRVEKQKLIIRACTVSEQTMNISIWEHHKNMIFCKCLGQDY